MPVLDVHSTHLIYGDDGSANNNPQRRYADWSRHITAEAVTNPSVKEYDLQPGEVKQIFSGSRSTSIDGTTAFDLSLHPTKDGVYRLTFSGGTAPAFRTKRSLDLSSEEITITINNNATAIFSLDISSLKNFNVVQVGDIVFLPGVTTGDSTNVFNPNNEGFWVVLARNSRALILKRRSGEDFVGAAEVVTLASASQFQVFSASGVQVNDTMEIAAGFSTLTQKTFIVSELTADRVEFLSTESLPLETNVTPTASGLVFYSEAKRFVRVEVDQEGVVRVNGDTGNTQRLSPRIAGDSEAVAHYEKWGPCWDLVVVNRSSTATMTVNVLSVE